MNIPGSDRPFVIIGENLHTTRTISRKGKLVGNSPSGTEAVRFRDGQNHRRFLTIPDAVKKSQDYDQGQVKHVKIAVQQAMLGDSEARDYLQRQTQRQDQAGVDFLDLNVDEISLKLEEQQETMRWLVRTIAEMSSTPLAIDSSNSEILKVGIEAAASLPARPLLNSASLERVDTLDLARGCNARIVVSAAGESGMPQSTEERVDHAREMVRRALSLEFAPADIFVDPLIFPISVDSRYGRHVFDAIRILRDELDSKIHITGGFSNVSFGLPCRQLINDVFLRLAFEAGADSAIMDPTSASLIDIFSTEGNCHAHRLAKNMLMGEDEYCTSFLRAYRNGELTT